MSIVIPFERPKFSLRFTPRERECAGCQREYTKIDTEYFTAIRTTFSEGVIHALCCDDCVARLIRCSESENRIRRQAIARRVQRNPDRYLW